VLHTHNTVHSKKDVNRVHRALPGHVSVVQTAAGHRWGYVECGRYGSRISVWSTPRSPSDHAKDLQRFTAHQLHDTEEEA
jgi:hypothetical protein